MEEIVLLPSPFGGLKSEQRGLETGAIELVGKTGNAPDNNSIC
jgi:hypothetical protein